jgi:hypothetical protein
LSWKNICTSESCCGSIDEIDPGSVTAARAVLRIGGDALPEWGEEVEDGLKGDVEEDGLDVEELDAYVSN